ncbi:MAG: RidA family protein [Deltaproteobacteria bacterium]|nr:RidA family protein [Deltaproteobacteria bacterium]
MKNISRFKRVYSGAPWEGKVGYCRALKAGDHVYVTGTAPINNDGSVFKPGKAYDQAKRCFEIIEKSLSDLNVPLSKIVRTRMFVTKISKWKEFGQAHRDFFQNHPPTTTMVEVRALINPQMMIEVEADAYIGD